MVFSWKLCRKQKTRWLLFFLTGFFAGIALICLFYEELVIENGFLDGSFLDGLRYLDVNRNKLFAYCLQKRLGIAAFLLLLFAAGAGWAGVSLLLVWFGGSVGVVLTALSMRYGFKGIFFFLSCILPQQLLLIPGYLMLMDWCCRKPERKKLLLPFLVVITGCFLESYVNPGILKLVLRFF